MNKETLLSILRNYGKVMHAIDNYVSKKLNVNKDKISVYIDCFDNESIAVSIYDANTEIFYNTMYVYIDDLVNCMS